MPQRDGGCFADSPDYIDGRSKDIVIHELDINALNWCDTLLLCLTAEFLMRVRVLNWGMPMQKGNDVLDLKLTHDLCLRRLQSKADQFS